MSTFAYHSGMPSPAMKDVRTRPVFKRSDLVLFIIITGCSLYTILNFARQWLALRDWLAYPMPMLLLTGLILLVLVITLGRWVLLPLMIKPESMPARPGLRVAMVTTFVPGSEPIEMLKATVTAMVACDYPHETWVLDEGNDLEVLQLCTAIGAHHFSRKNSPEHQMREGRFSSLSKHGNYNAWLHKIAFDRYDFVTILDPDHIPQPFFLKTVLGYFDDPKIGYVQAAQAYYNQKASFIACGAAEETYGYYSSVQMASYRMGFPIVTGSHNTHRMEALKEIGGLPAHDAEDLMISYLYRAKGWQGVYVPGILARGLTPVDWNGYIRQQRRWARSVLDIKLRRFSKLTSAASLPTRIMGLLHGLNYLHKCFVILAGLLLLVWMLGQNASLTFATNVSLGIRFALMFFALQAGELYRQSFYLDRKRERGFHWKIPIMNYAKWPFLLGAVWDVLWDRKLPYALTEKSRSTKSRPVLLIPNLTIILILSLATVFGLWIKPMFNPFLHLTAGMFVTGSALLIWSERIAFPAPFDPGLLNEIRNGGNNCVTLSDRRDSRMLIAQAGE